MTVNTLIFKAAAHQRADITFQHVSILICVNLTLLK